MLQNRIELICIVTYNYSMNDHTPNIVIELLREIRKDQKVSYHDIREIKEHLVDMKIAVSS